MFGDEPVNSNPSLDVWAIGLMFYALIYGTLPFRGKTDKELKERIRAAKLVFPKDPIITPECKEIIKNMLAPDPNERMKLLDMMENPYSKYEDDDFEKIVEENLIKNQKLPPVVDEEEKEE